MGVEVGLGRRGQAPAQLPLGEAGEQADNLYFGDLIAQWG